MQYSDTVTKLGIVEDIDFLVGTNSSNYSTANKTRAVNERFGLIWAMIFEAYGGWMFIDDNVSDASTGVPYGDQTLTSGTGLYVLPSAALTVRGVSTYNGSSRATLKPLTHEEFQEMGGDAAFPSSGTPEWYMLQGDVVRVLPVPNFTQASTGLRVAFDQSISKFAASDTTKVPGFASPFHRMLSIGGALDYALANGQQKKANNLSSLWNDYERRIKSFYSKRWVERQPNRIGAGDDLVEEFS